MTSNENDCEEIENHLLQSSRPISEFEKLNRIGEGAYGVVYRARDTKTNEFVALKRLRTVNKDEGMQVTTLREIRILKACHHENIVTLNEVLVGDKWGRTNLYLSLEYCERDLSTIVDNKRVPLLESHVKCVSLQVLEGLKYLHSMNIVHRDLKISNLLMNDKGCVKIADFGLARYLHESPQRMTPQVVTLWYRAPELLLGSTEQHFSLDMWAFGCVFAELLKQEPLWPGNTEISQLGLITALLGTPTTKSWPDLEELPCSSTFSFTPQPENHLKQKFLKLSDDGINLLRGLLTYDPKQRLSAEQCLQSRYFLNEPLSCDREELAQIPHPEDIIQSETFQPLLVTQNEPLALPDGVTSADIAAFVNSLNKTRHFD